LDFTKDLGDLVRSGSFSHGSLPGSLPVVRFPLRLDQLLGGRPVTYDTSSYNGYITIQNVDRNGKALPFPAGLLSAQTVSTFYFGYGS